jgi:hypothetical protein
MKKLAASAADKNLGRRKVFSSSAALMDNNPALVAPTSYFRPRPDRWKSSIPVLIDSRGSVP